VCFPSTQNRERAREERNRDERVRLRDQRDEIEGEREAEIGRERDVERDRETKRPGERGCWRERESTTLFPAVWKPIFRWPELGRRSMEPMNLNPPDPGVRPV